MRTTSIPSSRTIRIAAGIAVRFQVTFSSGNEQPPAEELSLPRVALEARRAVQLLGRARGRAGPTKRARCTQASVGVGRSSSRWIHFGSSGASTCVSIPSSGQVRRELERPLHAAAARGREVERDEQDLHDGRR